MQEATTRVGVSDGQVEIEAGWSEGLMVSSLERHGRMHDRIMDQKRRLEVSSLGLAPRECGWAG